MLALSPFVRVRFSFIIRRNDSKREIFGLYRDAITSIYAKKCMQLQAHILITMTSWICVNYLTNRFHVAVCLFCKRSQITSKCVKDKKKVTACVTDVHGTWNPFVLYNIIKKWKSLQWRHWYLCPLISHR